MTDMSPEELEQLRKVGQEYAAHAERARRTEEAELKLELALSDNVSLAEDLKKMTERCAALDAANMRLNRKMAGTDRDSLKNNETWSRGIRAQSEFATHLATELLRFQKIASLVCYHPINFDTCGVCGKHYWECDEDLVHLGDMDGPTEPACPGGKARLLLRAQPDVAFRKGAVAIAQLRLLLQQMVSGEVTDTKRAAEGLLGPAIAGLESALGLP